MRPLVSKGKDRAGLYQPPIRLPTAESWRPWPELEIRSPSADPAIIADFDGRAGTESALLFNLDHPGQQWNWLVFDERSKGSHAVWTLARPVLRGQGARVTPIRLLGRISEYLPHANGADVGHHGVLSHNPMARPQGPDRQTI